MKKMIVFLFCIMQFGQLGARVFQLPSHVYLWDGFERDLAKRRSSAPYISGDTFRSFCDHVFDETKTFIDVDAIKPGDTVFLVFDVLPYFFQTVYKHIKHPFIIVTHNRDESLPGNFATYLNDEKIIAWFAVNPDYSHPKLHAIPIGIANSYWPHGNPETLKRQSALHVEKQILLLASHLAPTHESRRHIYGYFRQMPYCYFANQKPHEQYLADLCRSKFVLSPRGNGLDCHRTWEALYMGAIPIVPSTTINSVYADLPVVIVNDWAVLTQTYLEQQWIEYSKKPFKIEKIYADYWFDLISQYAQRAKSVV
jgi:hypothetical protein